MKRWFIALALTALVGVSAAQEQSENSDRIDKQQLAQEVVDASGEHAEWLPSFVGVLAEGPFKIRFVPAPEGQGPRIVYDTKGYYTSKFKAEVNKDRLLVIREKYDAKRVSVTEVTLYYTQMESVRMVGCDARFEEPLTATMADLYASGGAVVYAALDVTDLYLDVTGKSTVELSGKARYLKILASTGKIDASALESMSAVISVSHKAEVSLDVSERIEASASTAGQIQYKGEPVVVRGSTSIFGGRIVAVD